MARLFNGTSHRYYQLLNALGSSSPLTLMGWFNPAATAQDGVIACLGTDGSVNDVIRLTFNATGFEISASSRQGAGTEAFATTSGAGTAGQTTGMWGCAVGVWASATDRRAFYGRPGIAAIKASNTTSAAPAVPNAFDVASRPNASVWFKGHLAHICCWRVALSDTEAGMLAQGAHPLTVRPDQILFYHPLETGNSGLDRARDLGPLALKPLLPATALGAAAPPATAASGQTVADPPLLPYLPWWVDQFDELTREKLSVAAGGTVTFAATPAGVATIAAAQVLSLAYAAIASGATTVTNNDVRTLALAAIANGTATVIADEVAANRVFAAAASGQASVIATLDSPAGGITVVALTRDQFAVIHHHHGY